MCGLLCFLVFLASTQARSIPHTDSLQAAANDIPVPRIEWFDQRTDHFNAMTEPTIFQQRLLIHADSFNGTGALLFYCGNEGDIFQFYNNTGWPFDVAPGLGALVVFAEHRMYGMSMPTGNSSLTPPAIGLLSIEQALADYVQVIEYLVTAYYPRGSRPAVIAFGGSYGGMLAAWMRIKYPHIVDMALSASAPLKMVSGESSDFAFFETLTNTFAKADAACPSAVRNAFTALVELTESGKLDELQTLFNLCSPVAAGDVEHLKLWVANAFTSLGMCDYPYPTSFLAPLPAFPVREACKRVMAEAASPLPGLASAASLFYGGADSKCRDIYSDFIECADQTGCGVGNAGVAWDYQACTEVIYYPSTNNKTDMFPPRIWNNTQLTTHCKAKFGITPRPTWLKDLFGGSKIAESASRIIFSNGLLDPWSAGGFLENLSESLIAITIADGAHHLDLRGAHKDDPQSVIDARNQELAQLTKWIHEVSETSSH